MGTKAQRKEVTGKNTGLHLSFLTPIQMALCCFNNNPWKPELGVLTVKSNLLICTSPVKASQNAFFPAMSTNGSHEHIQPLQIFTKCCLWLLVAGIQHLGCTTAYRRSCLHCTTEQGPATDLAIFIFYFFFKLTEPVWFCPCQMAMLPLGSKRQLGPC